MRAGVRTPREAHAYAIEWTRTDEEAAPMTRSRPLHKGNRLERVSLNVRTAGWLTRGIWRLSKGLWR